MWSHIWLDRKVRRAKMTESGDDLPAPERAKNIFVSYSREDRGKVIPLIHALEKAGLTVWWDGLLEAGTVFLQTTEQALEQADAVFVVWTKASIKSHWVRDEATSGRDSGRLVPVTFDGSLPPLGFGQYQVADLSTWRGNAESKEIQEVIQSIRSMIGQPISAGNVANSSSRKTMLTRRGALAAGSVTLVAGSIWAWTSGRLDSQAAAATSIAVLPFNNISGDQTQDYFAAGLSEELRSTLSLNQQLQVAAKTSSNSFQGEQLDTKAIARQLNVSHILDGSVRRSGDVIRISTQLIDGGTGFETWSESFDRKMTDIFAVQDEIAWTVADALVATISTTSAETGQRLGGTKNSNAYDSYLQGQALYDQAADQDTYQQALALFDQAIAQDSSYAAAYAAKSRTLTVIANRRVTGSGHEKYYHDAIAAARQSIRIAPALAEGHAALGFVLLNGLLDLKAAKTPYQKSYELGFGNADILSAYAVFDARIGNFKEARPAIARALKLDPLNPKTFRNAGIVEFAARDFDAAASHLDQSLAINPKANGVNSIMGDMAIASGSLDQAGNFFRAETNQLLQQRGLAIVEYKLNNIPEAQKIFADMAARTGENSFYQQAEVLAQWGDADAAMENLTRAYGLKDSSLVLLRNDPLLDPLRNDPRFKDLQLKLGFE
jgi:TolB-like protein/tetratricopeptide (TPR) repeat protein